LNVTCLVPREVFKGAILANAASIILCHNHPSGDLTPSKEDIHMTEEMMKAGKLLGIRVLDHIIVSNQGYVTIHDYHNFTI
jgi:DNA repair protein RadC